MIRFFFFVLAGFASLVLVVTNLAKAAESSAVKGFNLSIDPKFPLGTDQVHLILTRTHDLGFNAVLLEVPFLLESRSSIAIDGASLRPGNTRELASFLRRAKVFPMKVFLQVTLLEKESIDPITEITHPDLEGFYENFRRLLSYYAKEAETHGAEGIVIPEAIENLFCQRRDLEVRFRDWISLVYQGELVRSKKVKCQSERRVVGIHRDTAVFLSGFWTESALRVDDLFRRPVKPSTRLLRFQQEDFYIGLGTAATGEPQAAYWTQTIEKLKGIGAQAKRQVSFAARGYSSDPLRRGTTDLSYSLLEKRSEEVLGQWLKQ